MPLIKGTSPLSKLFLGATPIQQVRLGSVLVWQNEIVVNITANQTGLILQNLFTPADWLSDKKKRVINNPGIILSGASWGAMAPQNGGQGDAKWGGTLTFDNHGIIQGIGGAPNSGTGGAAIFDDGVNYTKKCIVNNFGTIRSGGGGGGVGGQGGNGYWVNTATEGPGYDANNLYWAHNGGSESQMGDSASVNWWGTFIQFPGIGQGGSYYSGGYTYYRGSVVSARYTKDGVYERKCYVHRTYPYNVYTSGGAGGAGGRGQGSDGANAGGAGGAAPGTNAGWGGTGGTGGGWGANGNAGATGGGGNNGGGAAGAGGGLAGVAYRTGMITMNNSGTILGRVV